MRNGLVQLGAWAAATGAAVALSWLGVHAVLTGAAFEQPTALPLPSPASADGARPSPTPSATQPQPQPQPADRTGPTATPSTGRASAPPPRATAPAPTTTRPAPATSTTSSVHSYPVPGGRVAVDLQSDHASLVTATPDSGWTMQVWNGPQWFRVDFSKDEQTNSVIVSWNGYPPRVDKVVR
ncbi:hypothetical protein GCM10009639_04200 [Kitasatospora putterlickiae]|uniref:Secreted protein n=1 Tax=Kitasatospora putterlickiae TaxID=221725 RepID=A0ABP4ICC6_9ACTN